MDLDATPQYLSGLRARLLRVPPGDPLVQTLDRHVVELGALTLVCHDTSLGAQINLFALQRVVRRMPGVVIRTVVKMSVDHID